MKKEDFKTAVTNSVQLYIDNFDQFEPDPQLRIDPVNFYAEPISGRDFANAVEDADEAIENAAYADGMADETAMDFQASENPDFYPIRELVERKDGKVIPSATAISKIVSHYFPK